MNTESRAPDEPLRHTAATRAGLFVNLRALHVPDYTFLIQQHRLQHLLLPRGEGRRLNSKSIFLFPRGSDAGRLLPRRT